MFLFLSTLLISASDLKTLQCDVCSTCGMTAYYVVHYEVVAYVTIRHSLSVLCCLVGIVLSKFQGSLPHKTHATRHLRKVVGRQQVHPEWF